MNAYLLLACAIVLEVIATSLLKSISVQDSEKALDEWQIAAQAYFTCAESYGRLPGATQDRASRLGVSETEPCAWRSWRLGRRPWKSWRPSDLQSGSLRPGGSPDQRPLLSLEHE